MTHRLMSEMSLPIVVQGLRHFTVSITADVYNRMTAEIAREAVEDAMAAALDARRGRGTGHPAGRRRARRPDIGDH